MYRSPIDEFKRRQRAFSRAKTFDSVTKLILGLIAIYGFYLAWEDSVGFWPVAQSWVIHCADMLFYTTDKWVNALLFTIVVSWVRGYLVSRMVSRAIQGI